MKKILSVILALALMSLAFPCSANERYHRKALLLVRVAFFQNTADLIPPKIFLNSGRKMLFIFNIKCYTGHGAGPPVCLLFCGDYIITHIGSALLFISVKC